MLQCSARVWRCEELSRSSQMSWGATWNDEAAHLADHPEEGWDPSLGSLPNASSALGACSGDLLCVLGERMVLLVFRMLFLG